MKVKEIIIHCSASKEGVDVTSKQVDSWHKARGFRCIGYHFFIRLDGRIEQGRKETENGAHCVGHNSIALGICYAGGLDKNGKAKDTRTTQQKASLIELIVKLMQKYNLDIKDVHCHNEFANKACPCFSKEQLQKELKDYLNGNQR